MGEMESAVWGTIDRMRKRVLLYPEHEKTLRQMCEPVARVDKKILSLIEDLTDTLLSQPGVGLAAPQIGVLKQVALIRLGQTHDNPDAKLSDPIPLINPRVVSASEEEVKDYDSCLSIPHLYGYTYRAQKVTISTLTVKGGEQILELSDLDARVALHEMDHLKGVLFMDHIRSQHDLYIIKHDKNGNPVWIKMSDMAKFL